MRITPPTIPLQLAKAYGVAPAARRAPVQAPESAGRLGREPADRPGQGLIAAVVPGGIDFSGPESAPRPAAIPLYRHPADHNAAATAVHAGRVVDLEG